MELEAILVDVTEADVAHGSILHLRGRTARRRWACRRVVVDCGCCSAGTATGLNHGREEEACFFCASHGGVAKGTTGSTCGRSDGYASLGRHC
jgi:hypothetical protein